MMLTPIIVTSVLHSLNIKPSLLNSKPQRQASTTKMSDNPTTNTPNDPMNVPNEPPKASEEPPKVPDVQTKMTDEPQKASDTQPKASDEPPKVLDEQQKVLDQQLKASGEPAKKMSEESKTTVSEESMTESEESTTANSEESLSASEESSPESSDDSVSVGSSGRRLQSRKVPVNSYKDVRPLLKKTLSQLNYPIIGKLEKLSGLDREKLFYIGVAFVVLFLLVAPGNITLSNQIVTIYPSCQTIVAVHTRKRSDNTQWLIYWCAFALFSVADHFFACFGFFFSLYLVLKTFLLLYLAIPQTYGAHNVYVKYVDSLVDCLGEKRKTK